MTALEELFKRAADSAQTADAASQSADPHDAEMREQIQRAKQQLKARIVDVLDEFSEGSDDDSAYFNIAILTLVLGDIIVAAAEDAEQAAHLLEFARVDLDLMVSRLLSARARKAN